MDKATAKANFNNNYDPFGNSYASLNVLYPATTTSTNSNDTATTQDGTNISVAGGTTNDTSEAESLLSNQAVDVIDPATIKNGQSKFQLTLNDGFIQSSNFETGTSGWILRADGTREFN